jgi:hypothetical protein
MLRLRNRKEKEAGENNMRSYTICTLYQLLLGKQIKEDETGGAGSTKGRERRYTQNSGR